MLFTTQFSRLFPRFPLFASVTGISSPAISIVNPPFLGMHDRIQRAFVMIWLHKHVTARSNQPLKAHSGAVFLFLWPAGIAKGRFNPVFLIEDISQPKRRHQGSRPLFLLLQ